MNTKEIICMCAMIHVGQFTSLVTQSLPRKDSCIGLEDNLSAAENGRARAFREEVYRDSNVGAVVVMPGSAR